MKESGNISKSQYSGTKKNPRCIRCSTEFPLSWTRKQTDEHEKKCVKQMKLFEM